MKKKVELVRRKRRRSIYSISATRATLRDRYEEARNGKRHGISHYGRVGAALVSAEDLQLLEALDRNPTVKRKLLKQV